MSDARAMSEERRAKNYWAQNEVHGARNAIDRMSTDGDTLQIVTPRQRRRIDHKTRSGRNPS